MSGELYEVFVTNASGVECRVVARPLPRLTLWVHTPRRWWNSLRRTKGWEVYVERADQTLRSRREVVAGRDEAINHADVVAAVVTESP